MPPDPTTRRFNATKLYAALNDMRLGAMLSWAEVSEHAGVNPSVFTRLRQGKTPHVDTLIALVDWLGHVFYAYVERVE